jgi:hypothetical protein
MNDNKIIKEMIIMKKLQKFFKASEKYMVASSFTLKPSFGNELTIMLDLLKNGSSKR